MASRNRDLNISLHIALPLTKKLPVQLNDDVWKVILDHLDHKVWLRRLLGVSKQLYSLALPRLYRVLHFIVGAEFNYHLVNLLSHENPGLTHVKELTLTVDERIGRSSEYANIMASIFVEYLPKNVLRKFVWDSSTIIPENVLVSLWARQHLLTNVELIHDFDVEGVSLQKLNVLKALKCLKSLRIRPNQASFWVAGAWVLGSDCKIDTLSLEYSSMGGMAEPLQPEDVIGGDSAQKLFHPFLPRRGAPLTLRRLELFAVDLRWSEQTLAPALEFGTLKELKIRDCLGTDVFMTAISEPSSRAPPSLEALHIRYQNWMSPEPVVRAIDAYLESSQNSLVKLWLCLLGCTSQPKASNILRHGSTLQQLFVDVMDTANPALKDSYYAHVYSIEDWYSLMQGLVKLVQLGVSFPKIVADGEPLFVGAVSKYDFELQLGYILRLPRLETLNVTTTPYPRSNDRRAGLFAYTPLVTHLATHILTASLSRPGPVPSRLENIAFGIREFGERRRQFDLGSDPDEPVIRPMYFTKARQVFQGIYTNEPEQIVMAKVGFRALKINNLAVEMLEEIYDDRVKDEVWEAV